MNNRQFFFFILFILFFLPGPQDQQMNYPEYKTKVYVLDNLINEFNENKERIIDSNLKYSDGYGNLTGFRLSYEDSLLHRNISDWPFDDRINIPFLEDQSLSILPNKISKLSADVWNTEEEIVKLPDIKDGSIDYNEDTEIYNGIFKKRNKHDLPQNEGSYWLNVTSSLKGTFEVIDKDLEKIDMPLPEYYANLTNIRDDNNNNNNPMLGDNSFEDPEKIVDGSNFEDTSSYVPPVYPLDVENKIGNITYDKGPLTIQLKNVNSSLLLSHVKKPSSLEQSEISSRIMVNMFLNNDNEDDQHSLTLRGIYHKDSGNLVAATRSSKFLSDFALPFLNLNNDRYFQETKKSMSVLFNNTNYDEELDMTYLDEMMDDSDRCEYITYLHLEKTNLSSDEIQQIDDELSTPLGRPISKIPPLKITNGLLYSPDCGILIKINDTTGIRSESSTRVYLKNSIYLCIVFLFQIMIFAKQMNISNTPSILSRLSMYSIGIMLMADGILAVILSLISLLFNPIYKQVAICSFLAFLCSSAFEMRFLLSIYYNQANERSISFRTAMQGTPIDDRNNNNNGDNITPNTTDNNNNNNNENGTPGNTPTTADVPATTTTTTTTTVPPEPLPVVREDQSGALYFRFMFFLISISIIVLNSIFWPKLQRTVFEYIGLIIINSYWAPQIYRNVIRGSRRSFSWSFIISTSIIRFVPIYYVIIQTANDVPFYHRKDKKLVILLMIWLSIQIFILYLQELLGARFMLPSSMLPKTYDYHPILTFGDLENDFNFDDFQNTLNRAGDSHTGKCKVTCSICMNHLEIPIVKSKSDYQDHPSPSPPLQDETALGNSSSATGLSMTAHLNNMLLRRHYMITPCRHIFHTDCLENWMRYKLQCPVCRNTLPPL